MGNIKLAFVCVKISSVTWYVRKKDDKYIVILIVFSACFITEMSFCTHCWKFRFQVNQEDIFVEKVFL